MRLCGACRAQLDRREPLPPPRRERGIRQSAGSSARGRRNLRGILASQTIIPLPSQCTPA